MWFNQGWTGNASKLTISFYEFWGENADLILMGGSLFPEDVPELTEDMMGAIMDHYYYWQIASETQRKFIHDLHEIIRLKAKIWSKLRDSELLVKEGMATDNYDRQEDTTIVTEGNATQAETINTSQNGTDTMYNSTTPDGTTTDIETYMDSASKRDSTTSSDGDSELTTQNDSNVTTTSRIHGNIGITKAGEIMQDYRNMIQFDYRNTMFNDLKYLFLQIC